MKYSLFVCLIAAGLALVTPRPRAQTSALQQGIRVQMASSNNAVAFPVADTADAWIIAVTVEGHLYFGVTPVTRDELLQEMRRTPRKREAKLYLKSDARTPYANVEGALDAARHDLFATVVLLTSRPGSHPPGTMAPPEGLEVGIVSPSSSASPTVEMLSSGHGSAGLKIDGHEASLSTLEGDLQQALQDGNGKVVLVQADGEVPFAEVVRVIDSCRTIGATPVLAGPGL